MARLSQGRVEVLQMSTVMMLIQDVLGEAWRELWRAKLRSALAILGVAVGAGALMLPVSAYYMQLSVQAKLSKRDEFSINVPPRNQSGGILSRKRQLLREDVLPEDMAAIQQACPSVTWVSIVGSIGGMHALKAGRNQYGASLTSKDESANDEVGEGHGFTAAEVAQGVRVIVINKALARHLLGATQPLNQMVRLDGVQFKVVGIKKPQPEHRMDVFPAAQIPYSSMADLYADVDWMLYAGTKPEQAEKARQEVDALLRQRIGDPGESFVRFAGEEPANSKLFAFMGMIGLLTLLSASIAVSNKTYIDVLERVNRIALRRALGATAQRVYSVVILESALLCALGCILGAASGARSSSCKPPRCTKAWVRNMRPVCRCCRWARCSFLR